MVSGKPLCLRRRITNRPLAVLGACLGMTALAILSLVLVNWTTSRHLDRTHTVLRRTDALEERLRGLL